MSCVTHPLRALVVWLILTAQLYSASAPEVAKLAFESTVLVVVEDPHGQPLSLGSGFLLRNGAVVTNMHVIEGASRGYVKQVGNKTKHNIEGTLRLDARCDLAVLFVPTLTAPALKLGDSNKVAVGDTIYAVGNPRGLEGTFSQGIISSIRSFGTDTVLQITAPISPGSSGGPLLNEKGEVVGVAFATYKGGQNLNFAVPVSYLVRLAQDTTPASANLSRATPKQKSILQEIGGTKSTEGVNGGQFLWRNGLKDWGDFSISVHNTLRDTVKDVYCLVIFYDTKGKPLDFTVVSLATPIPGGLAKRVEGKVDSSVKQLTTGQSSQNQFQFELTPSTKLEIRILDFTLSPD